MNRMKYAAVFGLGLVVSQMLAASFTSISAAPQATKAAGPMIVHDVFFKLKDSTPESRQKLVDACKKYLTEHEGTAYFAAGVVSAELKREVNDRDWDVGLHIVFKTIADHDRYQDHPRHTQFIEENKATWDKVRVFDTDAVADAK